MEHVLTVAERCAMASSLAPQEWSREVLRPTSYGVSIFGHGQIEVSPGASLQLVDALLWTDLSASRGKAKAAIGAGAVRVNGEPCRDVARVVGAADALPNLGAIVLENGRRNYGVIVVEGM